MRNLLTLLEDSDIITDFAIRCYSQKDNRKPQFFGNPTPSVNHVLDPCVVPDISLQHHDTDWNECDISILPYLAVGYKGASLIEILKKERKLNRTWNYNQISYSCSKMVKNGLIERKYFILPFQITQCTYFFLSLKTDDVDVTQRILHNFARGERVYKEYVFCGEWGLIFCVSHSSFLIELMYELDSIKEITEKKLYMLRSNWRSSPLSMPPLLKYFDFEKQTLEYPYIVYKEKIKGRIDSNITGLVDDVNLWPNELWDQE